MKHALIFNQFEGGKSTDLKLGTRNSFADSQSIDFRASPSQLTLLPQTAREDNKVVEDLIQNEIMVDDGTIYAIGSGGFFYRRTTSKLWSQEARLNPGAYGMDYRKDTDSIYITSLIDASVYTKISSAPVMQSAYYGRSQSFSDNSTTVGYNVKANQVGSSQTVTLPTTIIENSSNLRYFQSDIEPLAKISVFVTSKTGTNDLTLTVHDGLNTSLGAVTILNANIKTNDWNDFIFGSQIRIYVTPNSRTYHYHLTSTNAAGTTISSSAANDMSTADTKIWADRFVQTANNIRPIARFQQYECFGNGNYLSTWEPINQAVDPAVMTSGSQQEWSQHRLVFPQEYECCGLAVQNEFIVIAAERVSTGATTTPQAGILFFWDGLSPSYNYFVRIPEGAPQCIHEYQNIIYYYAGGAWYAISGPTTQPIKIRTMPGSETTYSGTNSLIKIYPYAATIRRGVHLMAYPSEATDTNINFGVYSWGAADKNFPQSFGYSYLISSGTKNYTGANNIGIGMVKNFGDTLHISWREKTGSTTNYGIDVVDNASTPAATATWQSLVFDAGFPGKIKSASYMIISYATLPDGATITPQYSVNRGAWQGSTAFSNTNTYKSNQNFCRLDIEPSDFLEIQVGFVATATTLTPTITSVALIFDDNKENLFS